MIAYLMGCAGCSLVLPATVMGLCWTYLADVVCDALDRAPRWPDSVAMGEAVLVRRGIRPFYTYAREQA